MRAMRRHARRGLAVVACVLALGSVGRAQGAAAALVGKWVFVPDKSQGQPTVFRVFNTNGVPAGNDLEITQTPAAVTVKIAGVTLLYRTDGSEGSVSAEDKAGFPRGKAAWADNKLVATLTQEVFNAAKANYQKVPVHEVYSVSDGVLTVERTITKIDGTTITQKLVYSKAS